MIVYETHKAGEMTVPLTVEDIDQMLAQKRGRLMDTYFPDTGKYRRELYPKHLAFMAAGAAYRERLFLAANQIGKSSMGAFEMACHLTGQYPPWWTGKRFTHAVKAWACGDRSSTVRAILQQKLIGAPGQPGTGMVPKDTIVHVARKSGVADALDQVWVKHLSGGTSYLEFKSYETGRRAFEGTSMHVVWLDEEPPLPIYTECLMRTITTDGIVYVTFTPLQGITGLVLSFMNDGEMSTDTSRVA